MKKLTYLTCAVVLGTFLMLPATSFAGKDAMPMGNTFKGYTKDAHTKAFPQGHPQGEAFLNKCIWDEESSLYFCQYDAYSK